MSSRLRTSANLGVEPVAWRYQGPRGLARRKKDIDIVLEAPAIEYHLCGWPGQGFLAPEPRYQGARDGRRLGTQAASDRVDQQLRPGAPRRALFYGRPGRGFLAAELRYQGARDGRRVGSQAAADRADHNYARGGQATPRRALFYGFESAATNDIGSTLCPRFHQHGPPISAYKFKPPREVSPSSLCSAPHSPFLTIAFLSLKLKRNEPRITPAFPPHLRRLPHGFRVATSLSLSLPRHPIFRH